MSNEVLSPQEKGAERNASNMYKFIFGVVLLIIISVQAPLTEPASSSYKKTNTTEINKKASDTPEFLLSVPFYVYEEWSWLDGYWLKQNGNIETVEQYNNDKGFKHGDDYWFLRSAMKHPMRTTNMEEAKLFFVPTLLNHFDNSRPAKTKRELCVNSTCGFDLIERTQKSLDASKAFHLYPERHVIVRSHFASRASGWDTIHGGGRPSYESFFLDMVPKMQAVVFEAKDFVDGPSRLGRHVLPSYYVGARCNNTPSETKTLDVAMIARMNPKYDGRQNLCKWLKNNPNIRSYCGKGDRCPALANAKFGFHVAGDTWGSQRLMDVLNSGTVPIFTQLDQYTIQGDWIDWDQLSYYIPLHNDSSAYGEDPVTLFSMTDNAIEELFDERLKRVMDDEEGYQKRHKAVLDHLEFFDMRTVYPFDTYMYLFQSKLFPETRHRQSRWSAMRLPPPLFSNSI